MLWLLEETFAILGVSEKHGPQELVYTEHVPLFSRYWMVEESYYSDRIERSPSWAGEMALCLRAAASQLIVFCNSRSWRADAFL